MNNPYAPSAVELPAPPPRRALFSAVASALLCLLAGTSLFAFSMANSFAMSEIGMFRPQARSQQIEQLRLLWDVGWYFALTGAALCIVLGIPRLGAGTSQWVRRGAIWTLAAASWGLAQHAIDMARPLIAAIS